MDEIAKLKQECFAESSVADRVWELFDQMHAALQTITKLGEGYDLSWSVDCEEADHWKESLKVARAALQLNRPSEEKKDV
jgi:hypothetical protein